VEGGREREREREIQEEENEEERQKPEREQIGPREGYYSEEMRIITSVSEFRRGRRLGPE